MIRNDPQFGPRSTRFNYIIPSLNCIFSDLV